MADDKTDANNQRGKGNKPSQQAEGTTQKELRHQWLNTPLLDL